MTEQPADGVVVEPVHDGVGGQREAAGHGAEESERWLFMAGGLLAVGRRAKAYVPTVTKSPEAWVDLLVAGVITPTRVQW